MATRIPAVSPIARVPAAWPLTRETAQAPAPAAAPAPPVRPPAGAGMLSDSTLAALASMAPSLAPAVAPRLLAEALAREGRRGQQPPPGEDPGEAGDTLPAPLNASLLPPEARLLRPGSNPAAPLAAAWRAQVLSGDRGLPVGGIVPPSPAPQASPSHPSPLPALPFAGQEGAPAWSTAEFPSLVLLPLAASQAMVTAPPPPALQTGLAGLLTPDKLGYLLHAWNGLPVALRLVEAEPEDPPAPAAARGLPAMRLALSLPTLGRMLVQLQLAPGGVWVAMAVEQEASLPYVQAALPDLTAALGQAGLRLLRWRLERGLGHGAAFANLPMQLPPSAAMLAPALFRAAAEVVLLLQQVDAVAAESPPQKIEPERPAGEPADDRVL